MIIYERQAHKKYNTERLRSTTQIIAITATVMMTIIILLLIMLSYTGGGLPLRAAGGGRLGMYVCMYVKLCYVMLC